MRLLIFLSVFALLGLGMIACGGIDAGSVPKASSKTQAGSRAASVSAATHVSLGFRGDEDDEEDPSEKRINSSDPDADYDNDIKDKQRGYHDNDDSSVLAYGHPASAFDDQALTNLVERYYKAAVAGDGIKACSLVTPLYLRLIVEEYGRAGGPAYMQGATCPEVMSGLFKHDHEQLSVGVKITAVRVRGNQAFVMLGSSTMPAAYITSMRQGDTWRVSDLLGVTLP